MAKLMGIRALTGFGSLPPPAETQIRMIGARGSGAGAHFRLGKKALDCGGNPNGGPVAAAHSARVITSALDSPIEDLLITHFHWDHYALLVELLKTYDTKHIPFPRIIASDITWGLLRGQLLAEGFNPGGPNNRTRSVHHARRSSDIKLVKNHHSVPGSVGALIKMPNGKKVFYTGDFRKFPSLAGAAEPDLCIMDCTGAQKSELTEGKEALIREEIIKLVAQGLKKPNSTVYLATFSTNLDRIHDFEKRVRKLVGKWPTLAGMSMFANTKAFRDPPWGFATPRVVVCTGVWAQEGSKLERISRGLDTDYQFNKGDTVILSGSMPVWNPPMMAEIILMCERMRALGVEVIIDSSLSESYLPDFTRANIHCSGHASFPEICTFLKQLKPKNVFPTHGDPESLARVEKHCRANGINVASIDPVSLEIAF